MSRALTLALSLLALPAWADWQVNMNEGVTAISREVFDLHMLIFWICVGHRCRGLWGDVLFDLQAPEIQGCCGRTLA
jgi:hypothetical protein